jgi:C1A family cysteine protease
MRKHREFGNIYSPIDSRDYIYEAVSSDFLVPAKSVSLPNKIDLRPLLPKVRDQGNRPTCTAFSAAAVKEHHERKDCNFEGYFSPEYIYYHRENKPQNGMYVRDAMKVLSSKGICIEEMFPYESKEQINKPKICDILAKGYKISKYYQIKSIDGLKQHLAAHGPAIMTFNTYNDGERMWKPTIKYNVVLGSHAVTVVGYNESGFILRNSWGKNWGNSGHTIFKYKDWEYILELWGCEDVKGSLKPNVKKEKKENNNWLSKFICC